MSRQYPRVVFHVIVGGILAQYDDLRERRIELGLVRMSEVDPEEAEPHRAPKFAARSRRVNTLVCAWAFPHAFVVVAKPGGMLGSRYGESMRPKAHSR